MRSVYVETSVWGMVPPDQNPALRQPTLEFLNRCESRRRFLPPISNTSKRSIGGKRLHPRKLNRYPPEGRDAVLDSARRWFEEKIGRRLEHAPGKTPEMSVRA
jgi:hypothetical protein